MTTGKNNFFLHGGQPPADFEPGAVAPGCPMLFLPVVPVVFLLPSNENLKGKQQ
jgi:hypothetical protein